MEQAMRPYRGWTRRGILRAGLAAIPTASALTLIVRPADVDDLSASTLARDMAKRIEEELEYPGQIKVTVLRETRAIEYAR